MGTSGYFKVSMVMGTNSATEPKLLCKRTGLWAQAEATRPKALQISPSPAVTSALFQSFLTSFLVPLPNSDTSTRQRLRVKQMLMDVVKILKMFNLCQCCHCVNIWCHLQRRVFTSRNSKTQRKKKTPQIKPKGKSVPGTTRCLTFWGSALPVAYCTSSSFVIPDPKL